MLVLALGELEVEAERWVYTWRMDEQGLAICQRQYAMISLGRDSELEFTTIQTLKMYLMPQI